jgi:hypothetical protein
MLYEKILFIVYSNIMVKEKITDRFFGSENEYSLRKPRPFYYKSVPYRYPAEMIHAGEFLQNGAQAIC